MHVIKTLIQFSLPIILSVAVGSSAAAPKAELWEKWAAHDAGSTLSINHDNWTRWLSRFVTRHGDGINRVDYRRVSSADHQRLRDYINGLAAINISEFNRAEQQQAYWINLYNAVTVKVIVDEYPVETIRDIKSGIFSSGPWSKKLVTVEGEELSLDDIEHRILCPIWQDPRIHYAVNCASIGCPNLQLEAFTAANTNALMNRAARDFINHERGASVVNGDLTVSSIYDWFVDDFGGNDAGVIKHLNQYAGPQLRNSLSSVTRIDDDDYDWNLNDTATAP